MVIYVKQSKDKQQLYSSGKEIDMKSVEGMEIKHAKLQDGYVMITLKQKR